MKSYSDSGNDIKKLLPYAAGLLLAAAIVFIVLSTTLLSKSYIRRKFSDNRVYGEITSQIREKAADAYKKTDPPESIAKNVDEIMSEVITEEAVRRETDEVLEKLLKGSEPKVDGSYLRDSVSSNLSESLSSRKASLSRSQTDQLIDKAVSTATDTIDISKYTDKIPFKLSGGALRAVIFTVLALAALTGVYLTSYNRFLDLGKALLIGGGIALIAGIILTSRFDPEGMRLPLSSLTRAASAIKSSVTSRCVIFGLVFSAAGGGLVFLGKKA